MEARANKGLGMETKRRDMGTGSSKKGIFLTLDASTAMLMLFLAIVVSYEYYGSNVDSGFGSQLLRAYMQDAATVMAQRGDFAQPLLSSGGANTSAIREVLRAIPPSVCMDVSAYGTTVADGLAGYWKLDEDSGTSAADSSGNGLSGAIYGNPFFLENGEAGRAYSFSNASYVNVNDSPGLDFGPGQGFTIAAWINPSVALSGTNGVLSKKHDDSSQGYVLYYDDSKSQMNFRLGGLDYNLWSTVPSPNTWTYLVASVNDNGASKTISLYYNGVFDKSYVSSATNTTSTAPLTIGYASAWNAYFQGSIDDVRIYNRALSASEVRQLYANPFNILYVVNGPSCSYGSGEIQSLTVPFVLNADQVQNHYYYAVMHAWYKSG